MSGVYYIDEQKVRRNTAGAKAPRDISELCRRMGYTGIKTRPFPIDKNALYKKVWLLVVCSEQWHRIYRIVRSGDVLLYQHPSYGKRMAVFWLRRLRREKDCRLIAMVHDLESLRGGIEGVVDNNIRTNELGDHELLQCFDVIICHNKAMRGYLADQGFRRKKLVSLEIFDYLTGYDYSCDVSQEAEKTEKPEQVSSGDFNEEASVAIAGNLAVGKCKYIYKLCEGDQNLGLRVHLYGINFEPAMATPNMNWHGSFPPEELPYRLEGKYGLVWDGNSADTCEGNTGNYLRFNNPHKTSLYLAAGMPVIVWKEAAIADFVLKNHVGIAVDSLLNLEMIIRGISEKDYNQMRDNAAAVGLKIKSGYFFRGAMNKALRKIREQRD